MTPPVGRVTWKPGWRIIPSRFPPVPLFEKVADPQDLEAIFAIESLTNPRLREETGDLALVPPEDHISGPGTSVIMAAFTHLNPEGSRFSDGAFGVFYAARDLNTAVAETRYHRERFMRATREPGMELDMRVYVFDLSGKLHDLRGLQKQHAAVYRPNDYAAAQQLASTLRQERSNGLAYDSVRLAGGECAAVFRPKLLSNCRQERHLSYVWNGSEIVGVYEKRAFSDIDVPRGQSAH